MGHPSSTTLQDAIGECWSATKQIRDNPKTKPHEAVERIFSIVVAREIGFGSSFIVAEGQPYLVDGLEHTVVPMSGDRFVAYLGRRYGLFEAEQLTRNIAGILRAHGAHAGKPREVRRFSFYDRKKNVLYLSRHDGRVYKLDGTTIETVWNGDGALFLDDELCEPYPTDIEIKPHGELIQTLVGDLSFAPSTTGGLDEATQRDLLAVWLHMVAFADMFPAKPLLLVEGERGSGKTVSVQRMQMALTGSSMPIILGKNGEEDFGIQLLYNSPIALFDNVDSEVKWLKDSICGYTTSGAWVRRRKYTDSEQSIIKPQAFVAVATRNPVSFRRDDIADRCLIVRMKRREEKRDPQNVLDDILANRNRLLGEWIYNLNLIVAKLRTPSNETTHHRLAGFVRFAKIVYGVLGSTGEVDKALDAAQAERDELTLEEDPLIDLLQIWLQNSGNVNRHVKATDLFIELQPIAESKGLPTYQSPRALAQRLRFVVTALSRRFDIETVKAPDNSLSYAFRPKTQD